ncbi:unnamed protein product [Trichogramma brassicae]|uniref:CCHC-type domain-containing protein n=1 Tax=Trichogramma brassicae TaxID=86971 RepID=A0A6H5I134_9HYME|nr:unnamed protein product [Trichogramma brassicae]
MVFFSALSYSCQLARDSDGESCSDADDENVFISRPSRFIRHLIGRGVNCASLHDWSESRVGRSYNYYTAEWWLTSLTTRGRAGTYVHVMTCGFCGSQEHIMMNCPKYLTKDVKVEKKEPEVITMNKIETQEMCGFCNVPGHTISNCLNFWSRQANAVNNASNGQNYNHGGNNNEKGMYDANIPNEDEQTTAVESSDLQNVAEVESCSGRDMTGDDEVAEAQKNNDAQDGDAQAAAEVESYKGGDAYESADDAYESAEEIRTDGLVRPHETMTLVSVLFIPDQEFQRYDNNTEWIRKFVAQPEKSFATHNRIIDAWTENQQALPKMSDEGTLPIEVARKYANDFEDITPGHSGMDIFRNTTFIRSAVL